MAGTRTVKVKKLLPKKKSEDRNKEEGSGPESTEMSQQSSGHSGGFRPPPGIIHEALTNAGKK